MASHIPTSKHGAKSISSPLKVYLHTFLLYIIYGHIRVSDWVNTAPNSYDGVYDKF